MADSMSLTKGSSKMKEPIKEELVRIYHRDGKLSSSTVVDEARPEGSPLHPEFEWNNLKAGEEYRLIQARQLIRSVRVERPLEDGTTVKEPMFIHVRHETSSNEEGEYHTREVLVNHPDLYRRALEQARALLNSATDAVGQLEGMARQSGKEESTIALIALAGKGLDAAINAVKKLAA